MANRLNTAAGGIDVGTMIGVKDCERSVRKSFRGDINMVSY